MATVERACHLAGFGSGLASERRIGGCGYNTFTHALELPDVIPCRKAQRASVRTTIVHAGQL